MIRQQLAAAVEERLQIRVERVQRVVVRLLRRHDVGREVEPVDRPRRVRVHEIPVLVKTGPAGRTGPPQIGPVGLAAGQHPRDGAPRLRVLRRRIHHLHRVHLRRRQAPVPPGTRALQHGRIEVASFRIAHDPVGDAVGGVARVEYRRVHELHLFVRQPGVLVRLEMLGDTQRPGRAAHPVVPRRPGDDAVVVLRESLGLLHRLTPAGRAAEPVCVLRTIAVVGPDHLLGRDRHLVHRAPPEVDHLLGVFVPELGTTPDVTRVGRRRGVPALEPGRHRTPPAVSQAPGERPVPHRLELAVPPLGRHPHLDPDVGITRGGQRGRHPAERRQRAVLASLSFRQRPARWHRRDKSAGLNRLGAGDRPVRQRQRGEAVTRHRRGRDRGGLLGRRGGSRGVARSDDGARRGDGARGRDGD